MDHYEVRFTEDDLGGRCMSGSWVRHITTDLDVAIKQADKLSNAGKGGFVRRTVDGLDLAPDGTWV